MQKLEPARQSRTFLSRHGLSLVTIAACFVGCSVGWSLFSSRLLRRAALSGVTAQEVAKIWGGPLLQPQPSVSWRRVDAATSQLATAEILSSEVTVQMDTSYRRRGMTEVPGYEAEFLGEYSLPNPSTEAVFTMFSVGLPVQPDALMLQGLQLLVDGAEDSANTQYTPQRVVWTGTLEKGQTRRFGLKYRARGLETFGYALALAEGAQQGMTRPVTGFSLKLVVRGARGDLDYPVGAMSPTRISVEGGARVLEWKVDRLLSTFNIGVMLPDSRGTEQGLRRLVGSAPVFYLLFAIGLLFAFASLNGRERALHLVGLSGGYFLFFPLATYLTGYLPWPMALALAFLGIAGLAVMHAARFASSRPAVMVALAHGLFLAVPAFAYLIPGSGGASGSHTGLVLVIAGFVALGVGLRLLGQIARSIREQEEPAQQVLQNIPQPAGGPAMVQP